MAVTEPELLRAIIEAPDDEEPVLVYIDWLLERGDPRGEWVRFELAHARGEPDVEETLQISAHHAELATVRTPEHERLVQIVEHIEHRHALVRSVQLEVGAFVESAGWILDHFPVGEFSFVELDHAGIERLAACPHLARVHTLQIGCSLTAAGAATLAASPYLALRGLEITHDQGRGLGVDGLRALAMAPGLANLCSLELGDPVFGAQEAVELLAALPALTALDIANSRVPERAVVALAKLERLTALGLGGTQVGGDAIRALARMPALRSLELGRPAGRNEVATLTDIAWPALRRLVLDGMGLRSADVAVLVAAPLYAHLTALDLAANAIGDEGAIGIASSPRSAALRSLGLAGCKVGVAGARALAESPHLANLERLALFGNPCGKEREALSFAFGSRVQI